MNARTSHDATPFLPDTAEGRSDLGELRRAAAGCQGCGLYENATQTVFGEGSPGGRVMFVGEQPGDQEDRKGLPFVGPAGRILDRALAEAGIERGDVYVTNAVKHFKFKRQEGGGKRRIHEPPSAAEVRACRPWLDAEMRLLDPDVVVALGATAGKALLGPSFRVTKERGRLLPLPDWEAQVVATIHPSAVLRAEDREGMYAGFLDDLKVAASALG
ncbi:uracil-DNA glycosylase [Actinomadura sp. KC216]|uniref:UdgX family uracil-DNA binding protein n=1 Tax=Actinomadura sp. KC216 TaxID=2530370 RepID=UPI00104D08CB|nr:UdgX family uracil-DNA binding protein [Actinomadura sp. KC216]TDB87860.1 uracil-DNA glycosylase [Actinomadura sp. KC216]